MRRFLMRALAALAIVAGLAVGTSAPASAAPVAGSHVQTQTARDWWL